MKAADDPLVKKMISKSMFAAIENEAGTTKRKYPYAEKQLKKIIVSNLWCFRVHVVVVFIR
jgi:hypothetical protein